MIDSTYINDIILLLLEGDSESIQASMQVPFLSESDREYTGVGVFVRFEHAEGISDHSIPNKKAIFSVVLITSSVLKLQAEALLFFKDGLIN